MQRICVYCGSKPGIRPEYRVAADELGDELVRRGIGLVYGGGKFGLMGQIADRVMDGGGNVIGVLPNMLTSQEVAHSGLSELRMVDDMHARKALMMELADGFIALPGGMGTLEELFEVLTWAQLKFHYKPCAVLNVCGYYDRIAAILDYAVAEEFVKPHHRELLLMDSKPDRLVQRMTQLFVAKDATQ